MKSRQEAVKNLWKGEIRDKLFYNSGSSYDLTKSFILRFKVNSFLRDSITMDVKLILVVLTGVFTIACLFFGTRNGFYDSDNYHGNGSAH